MTEYIFKVICTKCNKAQQTFVRNKMRIYTDKSVRCVYCGKSFRVTKDNRIKL